MLSFRVSNVEDFRRYRTADEESAMSIEEICARLRGERIATERMEAGTALHRILQTIDAAALPGEEFTSLESPEGFTFVFECDIPLAPGPLREVEASRVYEIDGEKVRLTGHADTLGGIVADYKLTKSFDAEAYFDSYQWRCYLSLFERSAFEYQCFECREPLTGRPMEYRIKAYHRLPLYRYPEMEEDVKRELTLLVQFAKAHNVVKEIA